MQLQIHRKAVKGLGAPIGVDDEEVKKILNEIVQKYLTLFMRLRHDKMTETTADLVLRSCGVPCISYVLRCVSPARTEEVAKMFDKWVLDAYVMKHDIDPENLEAAELLQLSLPTRSSGILILVGLHSGARLHRRPPFSRRMV